MLVGMNAALVKGLKLPLDGLKMTAISTGACASYILFRIYGWPKIKNLFASIAKIG